MQWMQGPRTRALKTHAGKREDRTRPRRIQIALTSGPRAASAGRRAGGARFAAVSAPLTLLGVRLVTARSAAAGGSVMFRSPSSVLPPREAMHQVMTPARTWAPLSRLALRVSAEGALRRPAVWHGAFWSIHALNEVLIAGVERRPLGAATASVVALYAVIAVPAYLNLSLLVPALWRRGRWVAYGLALGSVCMGTAAACIWVRGRWGGDGGVLWLGTRWTFTCLMFAAQLAAVDLAARHVNAARRRAEEARDQAQRRLDHLHAQLNPHFLFNTLNSLYALSVARAPELPAMILRHAELLRYALEQTRRDRVPLEWEIDFLAGYVALERLRLEAGADVRLDVRGVVAGQRIAPMVFAALVENCFKHLGSPDGAPPFVHAEVEVDDGHVALRLRNSRGPDGTGGEEGPGIGLRNTRERLQLLYPGRHTLDVRAGTGWFTANLQVRL